MDLITFSLGVLTSIIGGVILNVVSKSISYPSQYPDIRAKWIGTYKDKEGVKVTEEIIINQQLFSKFRGICISSVSPEHSQQPFTYKFRGKFISKDIVSIEFSPSNRMFTDYGVAIYKLDNQHASFSGHAISFSRHTNNIFPHSYSGTRK